MQSSRGEHWLTMDVIAWSSSDRSNGTLWIRLLLSTLELRAGCVPATWTMFLRAAHVRFTKVKRGDSCSRASIQFAVSSDSTDPSPLPRLTIRRYSLICLCSGVLAERGASLTAVRHSCSSTNRACDPEAVQADASKRRKRRSCRACWCDRCEWNMHGPAHSTEHCP